MSTRPVWAEISRSNLTANYRLLRSLAGPDAETLAVVKANAYGHGALECAPFLASIGAKWVGVTCVEEALWVRAVCNPTHPELRILVMSGLWRGEAEALLEGRLTPVVWEHYHLDVIEEVARRLALPPMSVPVHLEIDTGMARQGVPLAAEGHGAADHTAALQRLLARFHAGSALRLEGVMTHFSAPEVLTDAATGQQIAAFDEALRLVKLQGLKPLYVSAGNSATLLMQRELPGLKALASSSAATLVVRPGLALYGYPPRFEVGTEGLLPTTADTLRPVLSWKSRVTSLRSLATGQGAGYNSTFRAERPTRLALLPCGYADGISRLLSNQGSVLVRGQHAPIAGRVSMDQTIVDVTSIAGVEIGDEVVLIGSQGDASISAYDIADQIGTIPYEVLCAINQRVHRVLVD